VKASTCAVIRTVTGDVPADSWGITNCHAHLKIDADAHHVDPSYADYKLSIDQTRHELVEFKESGGFALVDRTPMGLGRDPLALADVAAATGVRVVLGTGIYYEAFHPVEIEGLRDAEICELLVREICEGVGGTSVRAGIIGEQGTHTGAISQREHEVFRASAWAAKETGAAISTHTHAGELAIEQLDVLEAEGLPLDRVVIGDLDARAPLDLRLHREVARRGAWVQYDDIGFDYFTDNLNVQMPTDLERVRGLMQLVEEGLADRILLGSDLCRRRHLRVNGGPGLVHLVDGFRSLAREEGLPEEVLDQLLIDNPARMLALRETTV
jgi:phosphotriesterase-related protein